MTLGTASCPLHPLQSPEVVVRSALATGGVGGRVVRRQDAEDAACLLEGLSHLHLEGHTRAQSLKPECL